MLDPELLKAAQRRLEEETDAERVLDELSNGDPQLRQELEQLLGGCKTPVMATQKNEEQRNRQSNEHESNSEQTKEDGHLCSGEVINNRYRILEHIATGGMGIVYVAEQISPVRRRVAIKVIKPGMDSRQILARFAQEREMLGVMDHPNIARVYDGGLTNQGRPYFVMEYIRGVPITQFCNQEHYSIRQRVELFIPVCRAVQHAHQKGIIHRDLKPSNILVGIFDGQVVPKIIDFGVAKALIRGFTEETVYTAQNVMIGTLEYVAPEQLLTTHLDIDTRADIYSLGVVLYQLLCDELPFSRKEELRGSLDHVSHVIREVVPKRPSERLSRREKDGKPNATKTQVQLQRSFNTELDWIVMKCLEKDRNRRYASVSDLAEDLERYLRNEPIIAAPPSKLYTLRKFIGRHYGKVAAAVAGLILLVVGLVVSVAGWYRAIQAERRAQDEAATHRALAEFIQNDLLANADASYRIGAGLPADPNLPLRTVIDRSSRQLAAGRLRDQPLVEAALRHTLAEGYLCLSQTDDALAHAQDAETIRREQLGPEHRLRIESLQLIGRILVFADRREEGLATLTEVVALCERSGFTKSQHYFGSRHFVLVLQDRITPLPDIAERLEQLADEAQQVLGPDHEETLKLRKAVVQYFSDRQRFVEALSRLPQLVATIERKLGRHHPETLDVLNIQANLFGFLQDDLAAEKIYRDLLARAKETYPPDSLILAVFKHNFAACLARDTDRMEEAYKLLREAKPAMSRLPPEHRLRKVFDKSLAIIEEELRK